MNTRSVDVPHIGIYVGIFSLLIYFVLAWTNMIGDPDQRTGSDFIGFYGFGRIMETQGIQSIYDIDAQKRLQENIVGHPVTPIFYTHIPLIAPISMILVGEDYVASFKRWTVILLFLNVLNVYILSNLVDVRKLSKENLFILCMGAFLFDPIFSGLMNGQDTAFLLLGSALWVSGFVSKRYFLSGLGLSLTAVRPQIALFLAIPFFFRNRKVFWGFFVAGVILAAISFSLLKVEGTLKFLSALRYIEATVWHENHALDMPTISGIIRRNFIISNPTSVKSLIWISYALGILGFSWAWFKGSEIDERHIGLLSTFCIFLLPYAHYHDLILLLIPIFCLLRIYQRENVISQNVLVVIPLAISWALALGFIGSGAFKFPVVYAVMILLSYFLLTASKWKLASSSPVSP